MLRPPLSLRTIIKLTSNILLKSICLRTLKNTTIFRWNGNNQPLNRTKQRKICTTIYWSQMRTINFVFFTEMEVQFLSKSGKIQLLNLNSLLSVMYVKEF